jgi:hypothetical protein
MNMRRIPRYQEKPNVYLGGGIALAIAGCLILYYASRLHNSSTPSAFLETCSKGLIQSSKEREALGEMEMKRNFEIVEETHYIRSPDGGFIEMPIRANRNEHWKMKHGQHGEFATGDTIRNGKQFADVDALLAEENKQKGDLRAKRDEQQLNDGCDAMQLDSVAEIENQKLIGMMGNTRIDVQLSKLTTDQQHAIGRAVVKKRDSNSDLSDSDSE